MLKKCLRLVLLAALLVPLGARAQSTPDSVYTMGTTGSDTLRICSAVIYDNGGATGSYATDCNFTLVLLPMGLPDNLRRRWHLGKCVVPGQRL